MEEMIGKELAYPDRCNFDLRGIGVIEDIRPLENMPHLLSLVIKFPKNSKISQEFLPYDVFEEKRKNREIEILNEQNREWYKIRERERVLVQKSAEEAALEIELLEQGEDEEIIELLQERIEDQSRNYRKTAALILAKIACSKKAENSRKIKLFDCLLQTAKKKPRLRQQLRHYFQQRSDKEEQNVIRAICLKAAVQIALEAENGKVKSSLTEALEELRAEPSTIMQRLAKEILRETKSL